MNIHVLLSGCPSHEVDVEKSLKGWHPSRPGIHQWMNGQCDGLIVFQSNIYGIQISRRKKKNNSIKLRMHLWPVRSELSSNDQGRWSVETWLSSDHAMRGTNLLQGHPKWQLVVAHPAMFPGPGWSRSHQGDTNTYWNPQHFSEQMDANGVFPMCQQLPPRFFWAKPDDPTTICRAWLPASYLTPVYPGGVTEKPQRSKPGLIRSVWVLLRKHMDPSSQTTSRSTVILGWPAGWISYMVKMIILNRTSTFIHRLT